MRWIGLNGGYVSGDGRFLVTQVTVKGPRGDRQKWALHGLVNLGANRWGWTERPIYGPVDTKRTCQEWAEASGYQAPTVGEDMDARSDDEATPLFATAKPTGRPKGYDDCQECGVHFVRKERHRYEEYCGPNCFAIVCERVQEIQGNLRGRVA